MTLPLSLHLRQENSSRAANGLGNKRHNFISAQQTGSKKTSGHQNNTVVDTVLALIRTAFNKLSFLWLQIRCWLLFQSSMTNERELIRNESHWCSRRQKGTGANLCFSWNLIRGETMRASGTYSQVAAKGVAIISTWVGKVCSQTVPQDWSPWFRRENSPEWQRRPAPHQPRPAALRAAGCDLGWRVDGCGSPPWAAAARQRRPPPPHPPSAPRRTAPPSASRSRRAPPTASRLTRASPPAPAKRQPKFQSIHRHFVGTLNCCSALVSFFTPCDAAEPNEMSGRERFPWPRNCGWMNG